MKLKKEVIALFILLSLIVNSIPAENPEEIENNYIQGEIIVKYKENVIGNGNEITIDNGREILIYENIEKPKSIEKITKNLELYTLSFDNKTIEQLVNEYSSIPEVEYAEPNYLLESFLTPNDANYSLKYDLLNINSELAWNLTTGNRSVIIAIIDSGVDWDHPDLSSNIWNNTDENCDNSTDLDNNSYFGDCRGYDFVNVSSGCGDVDCNNEDNDPMDYNGHGTHTAGIASAVSHNGIGTTGVCWNCSIMVVRAGYEDNTGKGVLAVADVVQALYYAADNNATIISMSFGGSHASSIDAAINHSFYNGSILVAAAGNDGISSKQYPCAYDNVICVAAIDSDNTSASYSNYGSWVDLAAPGTSIFSTDYNDTYLTQSGTSMATPMVAGAIGLIKTLFDKNQTEALSALNNTGIAVNFTSVLINRINIYSAILSLDNTPPNVSLILPTNGHINLTLNQTFSCNTTDWQLNNITLRIWNSTGNLYYNESRNISGTYNQSSFNVTMDYESYTWNCLVYDSEGNPGYATSNFSLFVKNITTSLISPTNNSHKNTNETNFNCSSKTEPTIQLSNITFNLWNSSNMLIFNKSKNISGTENSTIFNFNFSYEDTYNWNCRSYNNGTQSSTALTNYSITFDITSPSITLLNPSDSASYTSSSQSIVFSYNVSDTNDISNCSLILNNNINLTNTSIDKSITQNFTISFGPGAYNWLINCTDLAANTVNSTQRSFTITAPVSTSSSTGGGGGSSISTKTYIISKEQAVTGYTTTLGTKDKIKFTFFDGKSLEHILIINEIGENYVNITIQSNPINLKLGIGQSIKLNLTSPEYYDLYIKLNSIKNKKADMTIQIINEKILKETSVTGDVIEEKLDEEEIEEKEDSSVKSLNFQIRKLKIIVNILVLIIILALIIILLIEKKYLREKLMETYIIGYKRKRIQ